MKQNIYPSTPLVAGILAASLSASAQAMVYSEQPLENPVQVAGQSQSDAGLTSTRTTTRDVGGRLFRKRAGIGGHMQTMTTPAPVPTSAKGGMAKGGMAKEPIVTTVPSLWEVYGGVYYYHEEHDQQLGFFMPGDVPGTNAVPRPVPVVVRADTEIDVFGGYAGVERRLTENWSLGFAVSGASTDVETTLASFRVSDSEVDTLSFIPYLSYYGVDVIGAADLWADLMYAYSDQSYDLRRFGMGGPFIGSPDGDAHTFDFNIGLTYSSGSLVHGPYAGFRYIDGSIDGYTESGGGLVIPSRDYESSVSTLGYQVTVPVQVAGGVLAPQFLAAWEHEFEDGSATLAGLPLAANVEDVLLLGVGVGYYGTNGWNALINYEGRFADDVEGHYVGLKIGKEF